MSMQLLKKIILLSIVPILCNSTTAQTSWIDPSVIQSNFESCSYKFDMLNNQGETVGTWRLALYLEDGLITISDTSLMTNVLEEVLVQKTDLKTLQLISIDLEMASSVSRLTTNFKWNNDKYNGQYNLERGDSTITIPLTNNLVDAEITRLEVFAYINLLPIEKVETDNLKVFSATSNKVLDMKISLLGEEDISVPAGDFQTHKIEMRTESLTNIVYVSKENPRIVRVDVEGMDLRMELVAFRAQ